MKIQAMLFFAALLGAGCQTPSTPPELLGTWRGISWTVDGKESGRDFGAVSFTFTTDGYEAAFGDQREQGAYKVLGDRLYTNAKGQIEKKVKILLLTPDTLSLEMNRAGTLEVLTLKKE